MPDLDPKQSIKHGESIIELKGVSFSYGDDVILKDINLEIHRGDYFGVIGPNGGGKTTLLKIILGLLPARGKVKLFGTDIRKFKEWWKIGYVSQKATQIDPTFPMTVEGVVSMGRFGKKGLFRFLDAHDKKKVTQALKQVEMEEHRSRLIGDLSGGQQQRVFIARALAGEPEMIVLDEPTAGIDADTEEQFYGFLRKLNRDMHLTLVLVSHDLEVIEREATELLCVNRTVTFCGLAQEFRSHKNFPDFHARDTRMNHHQ